MKELHFINKQAKKEFDNLPDHIREQFATDLHAIRQDSRPFSEIKSLTDSVGIGAIELIENGRPAYRTIYVAKFANRVYVLHAFTKTTNGVDRQAMKTAKSRYKLMSQELDELKKSAKKSAKKAATRRGKRR
jgi:phage-related protein